MGKNVPTQEDIDIRNKVAREKANFTKDIFHYIKVELTHGINNSVDIEQLVNFLYDDLNYRKINKDLIIELPCKIHIIVYVIKNCLRTKLKLIKN